MAGRWCDDRRSRQSDHNAHGPRRLWGGSLAAGHDRAFALPSLMGAFPLPTGATTGAGIGIGKSAASAAVPLTVRPDDVSQNWCPSRLDPRQSSSRRLRFVHPHFAHNFRLANIVTTPFSIASPCKTERSLKAESIHDRYRCSVCRQPAEATAVQAQYRCISGCRFSTVRGCRVRQLYADYVEQTALDDDNVAHQSAALKVAKLQVIVERLQNEALQCGKHNQQLGSGISSASSHTHSAVKPTRLGE